jgi:hypothetical protein
MKAGTRHVIGVALALAALGVFTSPAAAQSRAAPTLRPGLSDFGLSYSQIAVPPQAQTVSAPQLKPGLRDFGLSYAQIAVPPASAGESSAQQPVEIAQPGGFDWGAAGVGAAAMLGVVLLVAGVGASVVLRSHRQELRSA